METITITDKQKQLVEKLGVATEKQGFQPAASRILALLTVADDPEITFEEIYETLGISKSAASNAINLLLNMGLIEYITKPADRKRYFRRAMEKWQITAKEEMKKVVELAEVLKEVLRQRPGNTVKFNNGLSEIIDFMEFLNKRIEDLFAEWRKTRS